MGLRSPVLVLNRSYQPVRITDAKQGFSMLYRGRAKALDATYEPHDFDQWVERAAIPSFRWTARSVRPPAGAGEMVEIDVVVRDVSDGFRVDLPVRVDYADGGGEDYFVTVESSEQTVSLELPRRSKKVTVDPDHVVLAKAKRN